MRHRLKLLMFRVARSLGAFRLARFLTRNQLRILCYHGFSVGDEYRFMPLMFMRDSTFASRLETLRRLGLPVIDLDTAVRRLRSGEIRNCEVVITLDDGWVTNLTQAAPLLKEFRYPATVYVTTEHLNAGTEVFNVIVHYLCLATKLSSVVLTGIHPQLDGCYSLDGNREATALQMMKSVGDLPIAARQALLPQIAEAMGFAPEDVLGGHRFRLMTAGEIQAAKNAGLGIELHTHTHELSASSFEATRIEIRENQRALHALLGSSPLHFCYPSGRYGANHPDWLRELGIQSATTCEPGLNDSRTNSYLLRRHLDRDDMSDLEFEAEVQGFAPLLRRCFRVS